MDLDFIRSIGKRLLVEVPPLVWEFYGRSAIGKGAGGDKTYPIDKRAEDIVIEEIENLNEPATIVSEEYGWKDIRGGGKRILLDPIDGSKNALSGIPLFSTSIAVVDGNTVGDTIMGYVVNLISGDEFWAIRGNGSFLNGSRIKTQQGDDILVVAYEAQTPKIDIPRVLPLLCVSRRTRCLGSTALDLCHLAQGALSIFVTPAASRSFDFAAGWLIVEEAGGIVTDLDGNPLKTIHIGIEKSSPIIASCNESTHKKALELLTMK